MPNSPKIKSKNSLSSCAKMDHRRMEKIDNLIRMTKDEVFRLDGFVMVIVVAIGRVSGGWGD